MKLGKNASDTCAGPSEACGGEGTKKSSVFEWCEWLEVGCFLKSQLKRMLITSFDIKDILHLN
jgi:hypothetical protein